MTELNADGTVGAQVETGSSLGIQPISEGVVDFLSNLTEGLKQLGITIKDGVITAVKVVADKIVAREVVVEGNVEVEGDVDIIKFEVGKAQGEGRALYSLELLDLLMKGHNNIGKLEFATDRPLKVIVDEGDFKVEYLLAPRIESD